MFEFTVRILSTFFYVGYLPFIPGTFSSIVGIFIFLWIKENVFLYTLLAVIFIVTGLFVSGRAEKLFNKKDARCIVIDEASGMLLSLMFMPYDLKLIIIGFILFRILDTLKPYPAGKLQELHGSIGIMGDDIVAGLYTNIILQFVLRCTSFRTS